MIIHLSFADYRKNDDQEGSHMIPVAVGKQNLNFSKVPKENNKGSEWKGTGLCPPVGVELWSPH